MDFGPDPEMSVRGIMARPKPTSWQAIEAKADLVIADVFYEVDELLATTDHPPERQSDAAPAATRPLFGPQRSSELLLAGAALCAAGLVVGLWIALLGPKPAPVPTSVQPIPAAEQALVAEQTILKDYRHETEALAAKLNRLPLNAAKDPFGAPGSFSASTPDFQPLPQIRSVSLMRRPSLNAPMLRLPPAPPTFIASLPVPTSISSPIPTPGSTRTAALPVLPPPTMTLPGPMVPTSMAPAPVQPILVGVVEREGQSPTAVIRLGEELRDCTVGTTIRGGWVVGAITINRVILKRGGQSRTLNLGGDS